MSSPTGIPLRTKVNKNLPLLKVIAPYEHGTFAEVNAKQSLVHQR